MKCHCLLTSLPKKGKRCSLSAKFPLENPMFCRHHVECSKKVQQIDKKELGIQTQEPYHNLVKPKPVSFTQHQVQLKPSQKNKKLPDTINSEYLANLDDKVVQQNIILHNKCKNYTNNRNKILNEVTGKCAEMTGGIGRKIVDNIKKSTSKEQVIEPLIVDEPLKIIRVLQKIKKDVRIYTIDEFNFGKELGKGSYGGIIIGEIIATKKTITLKKYHGGLSSKYLPSQLKEILLLKHLNQYPETKIVEFYGICIHNNQLYLVLEHLEKTIQDISFENFMSQKKNFGILPPDQYKIIFYKILEAFDAIHGLGIVHNDIKIANIMIKGNDIRIIDLGLAEYIGIGPSLQLVSNYICTEETKAPDISTQRGFIVGNRKSYSSDSFSIGASIIHMVLRNYSNFIADINKKKIYEIDENQYIDRTSQVVNLLNDDGVDLLLKLMNPNTRERWCCNQALTHPYFKDIGPLILNGINRDIVGGGINIISEKRLLLQNINYTQQEYISGVMELCYLENIHKNYMNDQLPIINIREKSEYDKVIDWILTVWNVDYDIFTTFDSIVNTLLMVKKYIDEQHIKGNNVRYLSMMIISLYDSILRLPLPSYDVYSAVIGKLKSADELKKLLIDEIIIHNQLNFEFIPIWCHIMYIVLKLHYEFTEQQIPKDQLQSLIGKWVLFYFIQNSPFDQPLTSWELVVYCTRRVLLQHLNITIKRPFASWLIIDENKYSKLDKYYNQQIEIIQSKEYIPEIFTQLYFT